MKTYFFVFGYTKASWGEGGGKTWTELIDMFEIKKTEPSKMIAQVSQELTRLIVQKKSIRNFVLMAMVILVVNGRSSLASSLFQRKMAIQSTRP